MSLHYLLDGYNILHQMQLPDGLSLEDQRQKLIRAVELYQPQGSSRNKITIVFDGKQDIYGGHSSSVVQVIFSHYGSADDVIQQVVEEAKNKKVICVVTDDRGIRQAVRVLGADVLSVKDFLQRWTNSSVSSRPKSTRKKKSESPAKNISSTVEYQINQEMKGIWLKKKDKA